MKIANVILTSQNGGAEQVFVDYSRILQGLGHHVFAIVKYDAPYADQIVSLGIEAEKISNSLGYHDFFAISKIKKFLLINDIDAVFAHAGRAMVLVRKAIKKIKSKKIFLISVNHSMNVKRSIGSDVVISINKQIFYKTIDAGQSAESSFVVHNAVDLSDAITAISRINLAEKEKIVIGAIGRLDKSKGFRFAIGAIKKLEGMSNKKFVLKIAGSGYREGFLHKMTKKLNLEDKVEFCGWIRNKKDFFDSIDIFVLTSEVETFGLVLLEAMRYHKPIISTDADGPQEILRDGIDALIVKRSDNDAEISQQFAEHVMRLVNNQNLANKMIEDSFLRLNEKFSFPCLEKRLQEITGKVTTF